MRAPRTLIVSGLPPPVHGVSLFNSELLSEFRRRGIVFRFFRVGSFSTHDELGRFGLRKLLGDLSTICRVAICAIWTRAMQRRSVVLYFTPSQGGPGALRDVVLVAICKPLVNRVVAHLHGCAWLTAAKRQPLIGSAMHQTLTRCDQVICLGKTYAQKLAQATGVETVGIDNGLPPVKCKMLPSPLSLSRIELLFLGSFLRSKGLWTAADSLKRLSSMGIPAKLTCGGIWRSEHAKLEFHGAFAEEIRRGEIEFVGYLDEPAKIAILASSHFLLLPIQNQGEGQPLVILEAVRSGVLPICSDPPAILDLLAFPEAKKLTSREHVHADGIADTIRSIVRTPREHTRLAMACLAYFHGHLTIQRCAGEILAVLHNSSPPTATF